MKNLVFVISLKSDEARREKLKERFKNYGEFKLVELGFERNGVLWLRAS